MKGCKSQLLAVSLCAPLAAQAVGSESCTSARFADVGWADITVTTAVAHRVLKSLGYKTKVNPLSVPMTYCSLTNNDLDVLLGDWMPIMTNDTEQHVEKGTVETLRVNLEGAKCTLAVPQYVYDGGLHSFADIVKLFDELDNKTYGIEPGNDDDRVVQSTIDKNVFEPGRFKLMEPSKVGMLSQVQRTIRHNQWVMFLGWEPHSMNTRFQIRYLEGDDGSFGPNYSGVTICANARKGYARGYVNVDQLLENLSFTLEMESKLMGAVLNENKEPEETVKAWLKDRPEQLDAWLAGVTARDGQSAAAAAGLAFAK